MNYLCFFIDQQITSKFYSLRKTFFVNYKKVESTSASGAGSDNVYEPTWPHFDRMFFVRDSSIPNSTLSFLDVEQGIFEPTIKAPITPNNNTENFGRSTVTTPLSSISQAQTSIEGSRSNITPSTSNGFKRIDEYDVLPSSTSYISKRKKASNINPLQEAAIQALAQMDKEVPKTDKIGAMCIIFDSNLRSLPSDNDIDHCFAEWQQFFFDFKKNIK